MQLDPLPRAYYYYFWLFEPTVSLTRPPSVLAVLRVYELDRVRARFG